METGGVVGPPVWPRGWRARGPAHRAGSPAGTRAISASSALATATSGRVGPGTPEGTFVNRGRGVQAKH